jgi:selenocysteine lyase/cysteine desulfurase
MSGVTRDKVGNQPKVNASDLASIRKQFPGTDRLNYFDVAARALLPQPTHEAVNTYLQTLKDDGGDKAEMFKVVESARSRFASLIGADPDEIAITKNVSEGLNIIATAYPWRRGDAVVICAEREHPNNLYIWQHLARRVGIEIIVVPSRSDQIIANDLIAKLDSRTKMVSVSSVTFHPGLRMDVDALADSCAERGILLLVDGVQSVGVTHLDVKRTKLDALAVSTQKGLLGLYGFGFLYCRRRWAERLEPTYLARFGVDLGAAHEADGGLLDYKLMPGARRFDLGNYNFTGATAVNRSLELLLEIGTQAIERHVTHLSRRLVDGLTEAGLDVTGAPFGSHFANIVTIPPDGDHPDFNGRLEKVLAEAHVRLSIRRNALRFSSHCYNTTDEVDHIVDVVRRFMRLNSRSGNGAQGSARN